MFDGDDSIFDCTDGWISRHFLGLAVGLWECPRLASSFRVHSRASPSPHDQELSGSRIRLPLISPSPKKSMAASFPFQMRDEARKARISCRPMLGCADPGRRQTALLTLCRLQARDSASDAHQTEVGKRRSEGGRKRLSQVIRGCVAFASNRNLNLFLITTTSPAESSSLSSTVAAEHFVESDCPTSMLLPCRPAIISVHSLLGRRSLPNCSL